MMSDSFMIRSSSPSSLTSVPDHLPNRTRSPAFTSSATSLPASSRAPGPTATTSPSCGFSLAVSGMMMPPLVFSSPSRRRTTTRSWRGRNFVLAMGFLCGARARRALRVGRSEAPLALAMRECQRPQGHKKCRRRSQAAAARGAKWLAVSWLTAGPARPLARPAILAEVDIGLLRPRRFPLALNFRPQRQHVAKPFGVEPSIHVETEAGVDQEVVGARRDRLRQAEFLHQQADRLGPVGRVAHPAQRRHVAGDVALERGAVLARP